MLPIGLLGTLVRETVLRREIERVPEPEATMADLDQVRAYAAAGRDVGVMAPTHLFHTANACDVIRPGDRVLDLGCGPATQLAQLAAVRPDATFVGVDLSMPMLAEAREWIDALRIDNVQLEAGDITDLSSLDDRSFDVVLSCMTLHHLPSASLIDAMSAQINRILSPNGGVYVADFSRLRSERSIEYFATDHASLQPEWFTSDYRNSLRAAFSAADLRRLAEALPVGCEVFTTPGIRIMTVIKSPPRWEADMAVRARIASLRGGLTRSQQRDLGKLRQFFRQAGLRGNLLGG